MDMNSPVKLLPGIGAKRAAAYNAAGIETVRDLLFHFPRDYIDLSHITLIADCEHDENAAVRVLLTKKTPAVRIKNRLNISKAIVEDASGSAEIAVFNMPHFLSRYDVGGEYVVYGKVKIFNGRKTFGNPRIFEAETVSGFVPVYPAVAGILPDRVIENIKTALTLTEFTDPFERKLLSQFNLTDLETAIKHIHKPQTKEDIETAKDRLAFDELYDFRMRLYLAKAERNSRGSMPMVKKPLAMEEFVGVLPFEMTASQKTAVSEITDDLCGGHPMNRMLCGDVGSGKTAVAAAACAFTFANGYQCAFMAPTEILARQHYKTLESLLSPLGITVACLTGAMTASEHRRACEGLADGSINVAVGTHALISEKVEFSSLALVITDEQHRFGVRQRDKLEKKGDNPHCLIMSATPIPRTMAMMIYGDLDISYLTDMPKGRKTIETFAVTDELRERAYGFIKKQLDEGRQGYIVCARIDESDDDIQSVESYTAALRDGAFAGYSVGLLHGRLSADETSAVMGDFIAGKIALLVSTTVIEVGVDVPNATIILIEDAELFGLSQLHQLRGRVGRSTYQSYCILMTANATEDVRARLKMLSSTSDGYEIARFDLTRRGAGDFLGVRQSGFLRFKFADRITMDMLSKVDETVKEASRFNVRKEN